MRTAAIRLAVLLIVGRLCLDVATPFLPGAFTFFVGTALEAVDAWDARIALPTATPPDRPARDQHPSALAPVTGAPRLAVRVVAVDRAPAPLRLPKREPGGTSPPAGKDH